MLNLTRKRLLVTGSCGTIGSELVRQLLKNKPLEVIGIDNNESEIFFQSEEYRDYNNARFYHSDIRDLNDLTRHFENIDIVFHVAALKHVSVSERSPHQVIQSNIIGVQNIIEAAQRCNVKKVLFTSSDKAVNPTNVMGTSKLMGERLITSANNLYREGPIYASTRFGNVLGSSGSVVGIFQNQISKGGPITVTDKSMSRFVMSIKKAVNMIIDSITLMKGGEVFVTKMNSIKIIDLAEVMAEELGPIHGFDPKEIKINFIGSKPGEKYYEELMSLEEIKRSIELPEYFSITPPFKSLYKKIEYNYKEVLSNKIEQAYTSNQSVHLTKVQLKKFLNEELLLKMNNPEDNNF